MRTRKNKVSPVATVDSGENIPALKKSSCAKFFDKINFFSFFDFVAGNVLKSFLREQKQSEKISSFFREICEFMFKKSKKKSTPDFDEIF